MIIALAGRRIDAPDAEEKRFPLEMKEIVYERIRKFFQNNQVKILVSSAACGADLLAQKAARELKIERHIILPFKRERFRRTSVTDRPGNWGNLFDEICDEVDRKGNLIVLKGLEKDENKAYSAVTIELLNQAQIIQKETADEKLTAVVVWEDSEKKESDETLKFKQEADSKKINVRKISTMDYSKICFVIMPFGRKKVGEREIDFDHIYDSVFLPAIEKTVLPEGGFLEARRTDRDFFTGDISTEMFQYIEYSRFAVADISGLNPNVFYELGVRHHAHQAGTAIFRQIDAAIPFDINHIKAFPYEYEPEENITKSRELITRVLTESLIQNRLDSPVRIHLMQQQSHGEVDNILREVENAIRREPLPNLPKAIAKYKEAIKIDSKNPLLCQELGLLLKNQGKWQEALDYFTRATEISPNYSDAFRETGIAENKIYEKAEKPTDLPTGKESMLKAIEFNPEDFDALASLGGILKREENFEESLEMYRRSSEVSGGNPYPLLNELKLNLLINQQATIDDRYKFYLKRIERILRAQVSNNPPFDAPWSFFGLSEICLFFGDEENFLKYLDEGILCINPPSLSWQAETHRKSLELLQQSELNLPGLATGIEKLREAENFLPKKNS